jgi:acetyl esterase/lipase
MLARDWKEVNIAYQMPLYPMLDDHDTDSSRDNHAKVWNTRRNHMAWRMYLKGIEDKDVSVYAAPARQTDYSGLPPAYTFVCTAEPFYCETMTFIDNLKKAGVEAAVDVYEGLYHAFDMNSPKLDISKEAIKRFNERFAYAKEHYFAEQTGDKT